MAGHGTRAVVVGITANLMVTAAKLVGFLLSGSGALLSETIHSAADTGNQALLFLGLRRAVRAPDARHPEGYGRERFFWGLVSALGIFFLGAGVTLRHGIHALTHPAPSHHTWVTWAVLGFAAVVEGGAFAVAWRALAADARRAGLPALRYAREGRDPTTLAIILEDGAALLGVLLAAAGIGLEQLTGSPLWDAVATLAIGLLLGLVAVFLIVANRRFLLTRAVDPALAARIQQTLQGAAGVERVHRVRAVVLSLGSYRVAADVDFDGRVLAARLLEGEDLDARAREITDGEALRRYLVAFGEQVVDALADEVDAIEARIREEVPEATFVELEAER